MAREKKTAAAAGGLFARIIALPALREAWRQVRANRGAAGGDGLGIETFAANLDEHLQRLHEQLRRGDYRPGPLRQVVMNKLDGGRRRLSIPCVRDRVVQTSCHQHLLRLFEPMMSSRSHAYRPGHSVDRALAQVQADIRAGHVWLVDADIEKFFDNVPHRRLLHELTAHVPDARLQWLLKLWLRGFAGNGRGLAQGAPISPLLANLYLHPFDKALGRHGIRFVRYADDFVLLCRSRRQAGAALALARKLLARRGLRLHPEKTRIVHAAEGFVFLGQRLQLAIHRQKVPRP